MTRRKDTFIACQPRELPEHLWEPAAAIAREENPANAPSQMLFTTTTGFPLNPVHIAVLTTKYWSSKGARLSVGFMDGPSAELRTRIISHMNAWYDRGCNLKFFEGAASTADVRIARTRGQGYYSYLGTDVRLIPKGEPTMNLDSFTMSTPESEFVRVVRHETGHTAGSSHEHMRRAVVARIDPEKAIAYFMRTQGWSRQTVIQQVLTPIEDSALITPPAADETSIMCYQLPGSITKDGKPIVGGADINASDALYMAKIMPMPDAPPPPPPDGSVLTIKVTGNISGIDIPGYRVTKLTL